MNEFKQLLDAYSKEVKNRVELGARLRVVQAENRQQANELERLKHNAMQAEQHNEQLNNDLAAMSSQQGVLQLALEAEQEKNALLQTDCAAYQQRISVLTESNKIFSQQIEDLKSDLKSAENMQDLQIKNWEKEVEQLRALDSKKTEKIIALSNENDALKKSIAEQNSKIDTLTASAFEIQARASGLEYQLEQSKENVLALEQSLAIVQEREATRDHQPEPKSLWYPDDSGEWVEVPEDLMAMPSELNPNDKIAVLIREYREKKIRRITPHSANSWCWDAPGPGRIVAYKIIKKAAS